MLNCEEQINRLREEILKAGADFSVIINVSDIPFAPELLELCRQNSCGNYGRNWMCPPLVGDVDELMLNLQTFKKAVVFSKIYQLEDSFDVEGMAAGNKNFRILTENAAEIARKEYPDCLILSAGGCTKCKKCAAEDKLPCRYPSLAFSSLEAYGIQVSSLAKVCGLNYINGKNTTTFFGGVFIK